VTVACGIDLGTLRSLSYVAWLVDRDFVLDLYTPTIDEPLPTTPGGVPAAGVIAVDAPQGLPAPGRRRRVADEWANTPTRVLPGTREELRSWPIYAGLIEAGVEVFWGALEAGSARLHGLTADAEPPLLAETYPRYVIRRLWPGLPIPSKMRAPLEYVELLWPRLRELGYRCRSVERPYVGQLDAMLCAVAAEACATGKAEGTVGEAPVLDEDEAVIREGFIVSP
jgi:hypothetical protein